MTTSPHETVDVSFATWTAPEGPSEPAGALPEIARRIADYARAVDARDWELLAACFTPDAMVLYQGFNEHDGREAIVEGCRRSLLRFASTTHLVGPCAIELIGAREATSRCEVIATHERAAEDDLPAARYTIGGTYRDRLVQKAGRWRIARRVLEVAWQTGDPVAMRW